MTNINWKVRIKNPMFWVQIVVAIFVPVLGYMGITAQDLTTWQAVGNVILTAFSNPYVLLLMATSVYNAIIDPTTTGITDSKTALTYTTPNSDKKKNIHSIRMFFFLCKN